MKQIKRIIAAVVVAVMTMGLFVTTAWAEPETGPFTITIKKDSTDKVDHTYGAYQIFTGRLETVNGEKVLSDIQWGSGINTEKVAQLITDLNAIDGITLASGASASQVAKAISDANLENDGEKAQAVADAFNKALSSTAASTVTVPANEKKGEIKGLAPGYYLVKDTAPVTGEGAQTRYILEVVSNVTVNEKASVPSVTKKVKEKNDTTGDESNWQDAADYDIGDKVPFQLTATTASTVSDYTKYHVTFQDKQSSGLTAPESYKITVLGKTLILNKNENPVTVTTDKGTKITAENATPASGNTFAVKVTFENNASTEEDIKKLDKEVNSTVLTVDYESELNTGAAIGSDGNTNEVFLNFSNNPNSTDDTNEGKTPTDKVTVFTYEIKVLKVEPTSDAAIDQAAYDALTDAEKAAYVKIGDKYQKTQPLKGAEFKLNKKLSGGTVKEVAVVITEEGTTFEFKGIDAGEYTLTESKVPAGYNKVADINITVSATYDTEANDPKLTSLTVIPDSFTVITTTTGEGEAATTSYTGVIEGKILNEKGSVLPSTGGIGTTVFYIIGSALVLGAGVLLATKKKAAN